LSFVDFVPRQDLLPLVTFLDKLTVRHIRPVFHNLLAFNELRYDARSPQNEKTRISPVSTIEILAKCESEELPAISADLFCNISALEIQLNVARGAAAQVG
jgi:hypothetical protein